MKNEAMAVIKTQVSIYTLAMIVFAACIYFFEKCVRNKFQKQKIPFEDIDGHEWFARLQDAN